MNVLDKAIQAVIEAVCGTREKKKSDYALAGPSK